MNNTQVAQLTMQPIGCRAAQGIEFNPSNFHVYVGKAKTFPIDEAIKNRTRLGYKLNFASVDDQTLALIVAKARVKVSEIQSLVAIKNKRQFIRHLTHAIAQEKPNATGEEAHEIRNQLNIVLDDARVLCNGQH